MESTSEQTFVGLDIHRKSVTATPLDAAGAQLSQERFGASDTELIDYLEELPGRKQVVLEACTLWEHFYDAAARTGAIVVLSNPYRTRLIAEASLKTDTYDGSDASRAFQPRPTWALPCDWAGPADTYLRLVRTRILAATGIQDD